MPMIKEPRIRQPPLNVSKKSTTKDNKRTIVSNRSKDKLKSSGSKKNLYLEKYYSLLGNRMSNNFLNIVSDLDDKSKQFVSSNI